jgi:hypothetical protein
MVDSVSVAQATFPHTRAAERRLACGRKFVFPMPSWCDAWADRYEDWSTGVTADVPFSVGLARDADGPLVELRSY